MKSIFATIIAVASVVASTAAQLTINTPANAVVCEPLLITWSGGTPPYFLSILPGNQPSAAALVTFPQSSATSVTWNVNIAVGTSIGLSLRDNTGTVAQSAPFTILTGADTSCVGQSASISGGTTGAAPASTGGATTAATGTTTAIATKTSVAVTSATVPATGGSAPSSAGAASGGGASSAAASSKPTSGAASNHAIQFGAAGVVGAVIALLA